jgi:hypothetical protein
MSIDLEHVRRSRRLLAILVDRFGVAHFLDGSHARRVNPRACEDAIALACTWIERRTGRDVADDIAAMMRRDLRRLLRSRIASGATCTR